MKVTLDIQEDRVSFFMELIKSLDFIHVLSDEENRAKSSAIQNLTEAFNDVKLYNEVKRD